LIIFIELKKTNIKKTYILFASVFAFCLSLAMQAQTRYLDNVGTEVSVIPNINYGNNVGIITQSPALEALYMDAYQLESDTTKDKPVVIMLHAGSFLPGVIN
tara:strand:+ start:431 stop:736 length:306 start_codon:yes stop_codon:yes gene_type:complete